MPSALMAGLELLVQQSFLDDNARSMAHKGITQLERLRLKLLSELETLLQQAGEDGNQRFLLSSQSLAHELAAEEDLEAKLHTLLKQQDKDQPAGKGIPDLGPSTT